MSTEYTAKEFDERSTVQCNLRYKHLICRKIQFWRQTLKLAPKVCARRKPPQGPGGGKKIRLARPSAAQGGRQGRRRAH